MNRFYFTPVLLVFMFCFTSISSAQERTITGIITIFDSIPLVNAEIKVSSSKITVFTDSVGNFQVNCLNKDKIKISAKGFYSQKVKIDKSTKEALVNLKFKPGENNLDIAVGYGHIKEKDKAFAISNIGNGNTNDFSRYSNLTELIVNSSPSIFLRNGSIIIRGMSSLNGSSAALILIDGIDVNASQLSAVAPSDVKSINILKDGSTSIYGSRGANGVVLITTKQGKDDD